MARARQVEGLDCDEPFRNGAVKIVRVRFEEMMSFKVAVLNPKTALDGAEGVHDMRVASRRLRAALEAFVDVFPRKGHQAILESVKSVADALGMVRDLDVMVERLRKQEQGIARSQRQMLNAIIAELEGQMGGARSRLESTLVELDKSDFTWRFAAFAAEGMG
jgi:CHAD domain-containing protein